MTCDGCGTLVVGAPKFCAECGTPLAVTGSAREVRKTVTLLFTDVTGSTAMGEVLDPEAYRGVMGRYFEVARAAVERHGGTVEKFVGDAVLAVFGVPEVREDDAVRAVRAADELRQAVASLSIELASTLGVRLVIRIGVNTGPVVTGSARAGGSFATGDAVNTAARLEQHAGPGEVLLGEQTWLLVRDAVEVETVEPVQAKGKAEPVAAYRLVSVRHDAAGRVRRLDAPLVGRDRETRALDDALERTVSSGRGQLVTVLGAPGLGKTRLINEFLSRVDGRAEVFSGRCVSYGQGITFFPIVQVIRAAIGLSGGESDEVTRHALVTVLGGALDTEVVVDLLLPLLEAGGDPGAHDQTVWAVRRLLEQLALRRPLVVTVDDLHWAEPTLLGLLDRVRDETADLPLLLVCQARPELLDSHPDWGRGSMNSLTFGLEPFTGSDVEASVHAILGPGVPGEVVNAVAAWSGGNPLFVEEIVTHLVETNHLVADGEGWVARDLETAGVPATVSALLAARLDRLPDDERELLARVSVIGLEFTADDVTVLTEGPSAAGLTALARRDLLRRQHTLNGETWAFRHATIRDAAYDSLPKALRADLHLRYADHTETTGDRAGAERLAFVAHHLEQAGRLRRALAPHDPTLADLDRRTALTLAQAAMVARDRDEDETSFLLLDRALTLGLEPTLERDLIVQRLSIESGFDDDLERTSGLLERYEELLDPDARQVERAFLACMRDTTLLSASHSTGSVETSRASAEHLVSSAGPGDERYRIVGLVALAMSYNMAAQMAPTVAICEELERIGTPADRRRASVGLRAAYHHGPFPYSELVSLIDTHLATPGWSKRTQGGLLLSRAVALAALGSPEAGSELTEADALLADFASSGMEYAHHGEYAHLSGDLVGVDRWYEAVVEAMRELGQFGYASTYQAWRALVRLQRGAPTPDVTRLLEEAEGWTAPYDPTSVALVTTARAALAARDGEADLASSLADKATAIMAGTDATLFTADVARWVATLVHEPLGNRVNARSQLELAIEKYDAKQALILADLTRATLAALT